MGGIARSRSPLFLSIFYYPRGARPGGTERKKGRGGATMHGTSRPCLRGTVERATHECVRVGRANNSNVFGQFFEQESQRYLNEDYSRHCLDKTAPYAGIPEVLEQLRCAGVHIAVASNKTQPLQ